MARKVKSETSETSAGKASLAERLSQKLGRKVGDVPEPVKTWISTGSVLFDMTINHGTIAGWPVGRIIEVFGRSQTGKTYLALVAAGEAQKMGFTVAYIDAERSFDRQFGSQLGLDLSPDKFIHIFPNTAEEVFEVIEFIAKDGEENDKRYFVVWDSLESTGTEANNEVAIGKDQIGARAKVMSAGFRRINQCINGEHLTVMVLNQIRTDIQAAMSPFSGGDSDLSPGGNALAFYASFRAKVSVRKAKAAIKCDANGFAIGSEVKVKIIKSRFGSLHRECGFDIIWGGNERPHVDDRESWLDAIKNSQFLKVAGAWKTLIMADGTERKFQDGTWLDFLEEPDFRARVLEILEEEQVHKFARREGNAADYYRLPEDRKEGEVVEFTTAEE